MPEDKNIVDVAKEIESCTEAYISIGKCKINLKDLADALLVSVKALITIVEKGDIDDIGLNALNKVISIPAPKKD